jgi:transposase
MVLVAVTARADRSTQGHKAGATGGQALAVTASWIIAVLWLRWRRLPAGLPCPAGQLQHPAADRRAAGVAALLGGQKATLLWDGLPAHRSKAMAAWIASQRHWLVVERLPGYAPELNPTEALWGNLKGKGGELAYVAGDTLEEVIGAAQRGIDRVRRTPHLPYSFLRHCGLDLW